jgi:hypothetical protein
MKCNSHRYSAVFKGHEVVYLRRDEATADHAPAGEVMAAAAACSSCADAAATA